MTTETERESKTWWILLESNIPSQHVGYACAPQNADYWWFPTARFSTSRVFETETDAMVAALKFESDTIIAAMARLNKLKHRAQELGMYPDYK